MTLTARIEGERVIIVATEDGVSRSWSLDAKPLLAAGGLTVIDEAHEITPEMLKWVTARRKIGGWN